MKEQNTYDQVLSGLCDRVQRILPLAKKVSDEIVSEETETLKELISRIFGAIHKVAKSLCDYVKRGMWSSPLFDKLLMIAAPAHQEMVEEMDSELNKVIEELESAVLVEALRLADETSKLSFFQSADS